VEAQIESAEAGRDDSAAGRSLNTEALEAHRKKKLLLLSRARIQHQLEANLHPRHRQMLSDALTELEKKLSELG